MYNEYFGFNESPFNVTSDPRFFYSNRLYQEAYTGLRWGTKLRQGLIVMTGEAGTGKTTLLRMVKEKFETGVHTALILGPYPDFAGLLQLMLVDLGLPKPPGGQLTMMRLVRSHLTEQLNKNHIVCALFDEAQEMGVRTLRELELLLDLEVENKELLQIILVGSPELETKLAHPELRSIKQRVALWYRLAPLQSCEVALYIDHRVKRAGHECKNLFAPDAVEQIALVSRGIPRLINIICDNALLVAYRASQKSISPEIIQKVCHDLRLMEFEPKGTVIPSDVKKDEERFHFSGSREVNWKDWTPVTEDHATMHEADGQWTFEQFPRETAKKFQHSHRVHKPGVLKIASLLTIFVLATSVAVFLFAPGKQSELKNSDMVAMRPQIGEQTDKKLVPKVLEKESFNSTLPIQLPTSQIPFVKEILPREAIPGPRKTTSVTQKTDPVGAKVYLHTSKQNDRLILEEVGEALRVQGYTIPETRLTLGRTQGDVRFFFPQDRETAERVKAVVETELRGRGYPLALAVLERDGKQFQFAARGKIEVWIPPLKSG